MEVKTNRLLIIIWLCDFMYRLHQSRAEDSEQIACSQQQCARLDNAIWPSVSIPADQKECCVVLFLPELVWMCSYQLGESLAFSCSCQDLMSWEDLIKIDQSSEQRKRESKGTWWNEVCLYFIERTQEQTLQELTIRGLGRRAQAARVWCVASFGHDWLAVNEPCSNPNGPVLF